MARSEELYLRDIILSIDLLAEYIADRDLDAFLTDNMLRDAVVRRLEIIGEAAGHLSSNTRARYADVEWSDIIAFRNFVVHAYFGIDPNIVWAAATTNVPELRLKIVSILAAEYPTSDNGNTNGRQKGPQPSLLDLPDDLPPLPLTATDATTVDLVTLPGRTVVYIYSRTGRPDQELPRGWNDIPRPRQNAGHLRS